MKNREATVTIVAYDGHGNTLDTLTTHGKLSPELQLIEFMLQVERDYPTVTRYEMTIAY